MNAATAVSLGKGPRNMVAQKRRKRRRMLTGVSRQRRAANARERRRVQGLTEAFLQLRSILPVLTQDDVSKMDTLRLAAKWIAHLTTVLIQEEIARGADADAETAKDVLPNKVKEKLYELSTFEIEDFDLVDRVNYEDKETESTESINTPDKMFVDGLNDLVVSSTPCDPIPITSKENQPQTSQPHLATPPSDNNIIFHVSNTPRTAMSMCYRQEDSVPRFPETCDWMPFLATNYCSV